MKKIWVVGLCLVLLWQGMVRVDAEEVQEPGSLYAQAAVLMDADSGRVLYGKNADTPMANASTTKIMTCIVALENGNPDDVVEASAYAASMPKVKLYMKQGEHYRLLDLLYALMLESFNDCAVAIAEHVGGSVEGFAQMMNQKALDLGCRDTWFITPNGLDATQTITLEDGSELVKEHMTTARDLARIMAYCIGESEQSESFVAITRTPNYSFTNEEGRSFSCVNHNSFLSMMEGAVSGKTGFTNKAGYCYVGALQRDGRKFTVALLACGWPNHKTYKWSDTKKLMQYGIDHYFYRSFMEKAYDESSLQPIPVAEGQTRRLGETAYTRLEIPGRDKTGGEGTEGDDAAAEALKDNTGGREGMLLRADEQIEVSCDVGNTLTAPVEKGTQVGTVTYSVNGQVYKTEQIVTADTIDKIDLRWCVCQMWARFSL